MAGDQTQVIGGHDMILYMANYAAANVAPSSAVAWGSAWGGAWQDKGYTRDGLRFSMNVTRQNIQVDQVVDPVLRVPTARDLRMSSRMAQITAQNIFQATGEGVMTTATPAPATAGSDRLDITGQIQDLYVSVGFDVRNPGDVQAVRVVGFHGLPTGNTDLNFTTNDAATIGFEIGLVPDTNVLVNNFPRVAAFIDVYAPTGGA